MLNELKGKALDLIGKSAIAGGFVSETGKQLGWFDNVSAIQVISSFGIMMLVVERTFKIYWESKEKGNTKLVVASLSSAWIGLITIIIMVI